MGYTFPGILGQSPAAGFIYPLEFIQILHGGKTKLTVFICQIVSENLLPADIYALVQRPDMEHIVKHIITGDDPAARRHLFQQVIAAQLQIALIKRTAIVWAFPLKAQFFRHDIQRCAFTAAVTPIQDGQRPCGQFLQSPPGKGKKRVHGIEAGSLFIQPKGILLIIRRKTKTFQILHGSLLIFTV